MSAMSQKRETDLPLWTGSIQYYDPDVDYDHDETEHVDHMPGVYAASEDQAAILLLENHRIRHPNARNVRFCADKKGKVTPRIVNQ